MARLLGRWTFQVMVEDNNRVYTLWEVVGDDESDYGEVDGPLHNGILAAYDGVNIVSPLVLDNDLLYLSGFETEEEVNE